MDYRISAEDEAFRQEVRSFLCDHLPDARDVAVEDWEAEDWAFVRQMQRNLGQRGWLALGWPKEYHGLEASLLRQTVFTEEIVYHRCPGRDILGVQLLGPTLLVWGTEEQKRQFLPPIAKGEVRWCQGFSEPQSGSDLASVQTLAAAVGDQFVLNGSKIWTSGAHRADWMFLLARTDTSAPKHKGISFFLLDMRSPGITVQPILSMTGRHSFNQVFFDDVRIPRQNLVGRVNEGWSVAMKLLEFERSGIEFSAMARSIFDDALKFLSRIMGGGASLVGARLARQKMADMAIKIEVSRLLAYRVAWLQSQGKNPMAEAAASKVLGSETAQHMAKVAVEILGLYGQLVPGSAYEVLQGSLAHRYLHNVALTIYGGTSEIQRNIIARRGLNLPYER